MTLIRHKLVENTFYLIVVRPLAVEGEPVEFEEFEPAWLDVSEGGIPVFHEFIRLRHDAERKAGIMGFTEEHVNRFTAIPPHTSEKGVVVECGSSLCTFDIKVYIGKVPLDTRL